VLSWQRSDVEGPSSIRFLVVAFIDVSLARYLKAALDPP
jgi:hypothetical protein